MAIKGCWDCPCLQQPKGLLESYKCGLVNYYEADLPYECCRVHLGNQPPKNCPLRTEGVRMLYLDKDVK